MPRKPNIDLQALARSLLADVHNLLARWLPGGRIEQHEYVALNPTRGDRKLGSFRINIRTGRWGDFATKDSGGDLISLFAYLNGNIGQVEAARRLGGDDFALAAPRQPAPAAAASPPDYTQIIPAPDLEMPPAHPKFGQASNTWTYRTSTGEMIGFVCRYNRPEGEDRAKEYSIYAYFRDHRGRQGWRWRSFDKPRPLYGLETLDDRPVIVTEGEKDADAGRTLFQNHCVVAWPGGTNAVEHADFSPLHGRDVTLWPDNDEPGVKAMAAVADLLRPHCPDLRTITLPTNAPQGWGLSDATWTVDEAARFFRKAFDATEPSSTPEGQDYQHAEDPMSDERDTRHFTPLGHDHGVYYYHCAESQQIVELTVAAHTEQQLRTLAPVTYWEREYRSTKGADYKLAVETIIRQCHRIGIFDRNRIRGRGAWWDEGRCILNMGDRVFIRGKTYKPAETPSRKLYEAGQPLDADLSSPLTTGEAKAFYDLIAMQPWKRTFHARLLAGWCVCAHIGGVLNWRPHIWLLGKRGSGKSWVMSRIVCKILSTNCLFVVGDTTEAGIRQDLGCDSIPVIFDEAEGATARDVNRLQAVLGLVRQSSSETGGKIAKGGSDGKGVKYEVRSCFAFSSINDSLMQESDRTRVSKLELDQDCVTHDFKTIRQRQVALLTDDYVRRFYARAIQYAEVIRVNAMTFADAAAVELGEQRAGDQIGALLAGAYSLHSSKVITLDEARRWVQEQDWSEDRDEVATQSDEKNLWDHLMGQRLKFRPNTSSSFADVPIGVLLDHAQTGTSHDPNYPSELCRETLKWAGFRVEHDVVLIANKSADISRMLKDTPWSQNHGQVLKRLPGAQTAPKPVSFGGKHSTSRATKVPL